MSQENPLIAIEESIQKAESVCDAEIVVAFAEMSGPYKDVRMLWGIVFAFITLAILMFAPINFNVLYLIPNILIAFVIGYGATLLFPRLILFTSSKERAMNQVKANAALTWHKQGVSLTKRRTGVLIYVSLLERDGTFICDAGIREKVPKPLLGKLAVLLKDLSRKDDPVKNFELFLGEFAETMKEYVPEAEDNPDELPNTPLWLKRGELWD